MERSQFEHDAWQTAGAMVVSYAIILVAIFVVLFLVPYGIFALF